VTPTLCLAAGLLAAPTVDCPPAARYYFLLFAGESVPFRPRHAHTWATFVKATPAPGGVVLEPVTISWLPVDGNVQPLRFQTVPGRNWGLDETVATKLATPGRVVLWGPFETDATRYGLAVAQAAALESGAVRYRAIDSFTTRPGVAHCVHAVTFADPVLRGRVQPVVRVGERGTHHLANLYAKTGAFADPAATHDWLIPALGMDRYPIERRDLGDRPKRGWFRR
jgi:hypothetical protein